MRKVTQRVRDETHLLPVSGAVPSAHVALGHTLSSCDHWCIICLLLPLPFVRYLPRFSSCQHVNAGPGPSFPDLLPAVPSPKTLLIKTAQSTSIGSMSVCTVSPGPLTSGPQSHVEIPKMRMMKKTRCLKAVLGSNPKAAIYSA